MELLDVPLVRKYTWYRSNAKAKSKVREGISIL